MGEGTTYEALVTFEAQGMRCDKFLGTQWPTLSRTRIQDLLKKGHVFVGRGDHWQPCVDPSVGVMEGDSYRLTLPAPRPFDLFAEPMDLRIVYEDSDILVVDKPAGVVVHPGAGHRSGTLVHGLLAHCGDKLSGISGELKPGIVHRLDKGTSGLLVVAKNDGSHQSLVAQFQGRKLSRSYVVFVKGKPHPLQGTIHTRIGRHPTSRQKMAVLSIGGRVAISHYNTVEMFHNGSISMLEFKLETGRTHQIRVHCGWLKTPVLGDPQYGETAWLKRQGWGWPQERPALHAQRLMLTHPTSGESLVFTSPLPEDMAQLLMKLRHSF